MALFELDEGRLVQAQFGREVREGLTPDVLNAVRSQVLEIIARPLFPITWRDFSRDAAASRGPRLTALDASGQVVAVEVISTLDADILIDSLSRLADTAAMSWTDLASEYPGHVDGFRSDWAQFRSAMPPSPPNGPRLILVSGSIHPDVRPALDVLSASGVEVHEMSLRQMSNGRSFLEVSAVGPRMYGHRANLLVADTGSVAAVQRSEVQRITSAVKQKVETGAVPVQAPPRQIDRPATGRQPMPEWESVVGKSVGTKAQSAPVRPRPPLPSRVQRRSELPMAEESRPGVPFPSRMQRRADTGAIPISQRSLSRNEQGLAALAAMNGRAVPLSLAASAGVMVSAELTVAGKVRVMAGEFGDPTAALRALGISGLDGWDAWHLGDGFGPSLAESINEINRGRN